MLAHKHIRIEKLQKDKIFSHKAFNYINHTKTQFRNVCVNKILPSSTGVG